MVSLTLAWSSEGGVGLLALAVLDNIGIGTVLDPEEFSCVSETAFQFFEYAGSCAGEG